MGFNIKKTLILELFEKYRKKIKSLNETVWENKANDKKLEKWLDNFLEDEKLQVLHLITQFIYLGDIQVQNMLKSIYRDFFKYSKVEQIRLSNNETTNLEFINKEYNKVLSKTKFVSIGNISESSTRLMMSFRHVNDLDMSNIISEYQIDSLEDEIEDFVFIEDMCGSGAQTKRYSKEFLEKINKKYPNAKKHLYFLAGTKIGKENIKTNCDFDYVDSVINLDNTFKCFDDDSRVFKNIDPIINAQLVKKICEKYGKDLMYSIGEIMNPDFDNEELEWFADDHKFGFRDGQLLIGFNHNTPDNTLPILWYNEKDINWNPIFIRKNKKYND